MEWSFLNTKVMRIDPAIGNSYRHMLYHFGKPRASLEYVKASIFDLCPSTRVFDVSNCLPYTHTHTHTHTQTHTNKHTHTHTHTHKHTHTHAHTHTHTHTHTTYIYTQCLHGCWMSPAPMQNPGYATAWFRAVRLWGSVFEYAPN